MSSGESALVAAKAVKNNWGAIVRTSKWVRERLYPKPPINSIGFAIGIEVLDEECRGHLDQDFIRTIGELLERRKTQKPIKIVIIPEPLIRKIKKPEDALTALTKSHCVFLIFGKARSRNFDGKTHYVLDLEAAVKHDEIPIEISNTLATEMRNLLPSRRKISGDNDLDGFELNASNVHLAALYIIATAAGLSGDFDFSLELFESLNRQLLTVNEVGNPLEVQKSIQYLRNNSQLNTGIVHIKKAEVFQLEWRKTRHLEALEKMMLHVKASGQFIKESYQAAMLTSLYYFVRDRDTKRARKTIVPWRVSSVADATWAFDDAFFYAYDGKMKDAVRCYEKGFKRETNSTVLVEIEEFLLWILSESPEKIQFHFCLGMINYFGKDDKVAAAMDLERFLLATNTTKEFPEQRELARTYLSQIQRES